VSDAQSLRQGETETCCDRRGSGDLDTFLASLVTRHDCPAFLEMESGYAPITGQEKLDRKIKPWMWFSTEIFP